ncbi:MAG: hypothetical protein K0Q77_2827 [Anaerosporomusa subterranea]|jgi:tripartite-type tricarboxylate transporter receptor subunit TctC|nr:hypothetical protein [Anaerosporomusa subterranea]
MFRKKSWQVLMVTVSVLGMVMLASGCDKAPEAKKAAGPTEFKPDKPITMMVPGAAGGSTDLLARAVEKVWSKYCPQPLQIVNKGGGGGVEGATFVARAKPDGYTIAMGYGSGHDIVMPHISKVEYNPFKDLDPVARLSIHSVVVLVPANSPYNSIKDIVDEAKKTGKPVTAAVGLKAGAVDLVMRGIGASTGVTITPIPHAGGSQAITTLVGSQTVMGGGHPAEVISQLKAGRLKAIGIATPDRDPSLPNVPTLKEQGINFYTWGSVKGIAVPKNTPKEVVTYYEGLFKKVAEDPDFKKTMQEMGQPVQYQGAEEFGKFVKQAHDDYGVLVKQLGLNQ